MSVVPTETRKASDPVELEFQVVVRGLRWMLGTELGFSGRAAKALKYWAIFPAKTSDFNNWVDSPRQSDRQEQMKPHLAGQT